MKTSIDVLLLGGGLANSLIAWRLQSERPEVRWLMVESTAFIGGTATPRTWSFHRSDLTESEAWAAEFATHSWDGYNVIFPKRARTLTGEYCSVRSPDFHRKIVTKLGDRILFGATGEGIDARLTIDGRGLKNRVPYPCGYQKFLGMDLELENPHGLQRPRLMDASVDQKDGYRFVYVLPWTRTSLLIEDTYYGDDASLDDASLEAGIRSYAAANGWRIRKEVGRERGVLPIPFAGDELPKFEGGLAKSGVASGRFHPTTGYSFAAAARFANRVCEVPRFTRDVADKLNAEAVESWRRGDFFRRLNNMMFRAAEPNQRRDVMAQFYGRDLALIQRFYRGDLGKLDQLRLLSGRPPVPMAKGLRAFAERLSGEAAPW